MSNDFDPYHKWLGISPAEQPPNHYRLLGIERFESNADVISNAADQRMTFLRTFQSGKQAALCQRLLNEVSAARLCLLSDTARAEYDRRLRKTFEAGSQATSKTPAHPGAIPITLASTSTTSAGNTAKPLPRAQPLDPFAADPVPSWDLPKAPLPPSLAVKPNGTRKQSNHVVLIAGGAGAALCVLLLVGYLMMQGRTATPTREVAVESKTGGTKQEEIERKESTNDIAPTPSMPSSPSTSNPAPIPPATPKPIAPVTPPVVPPPPPVAFSNTPTSVAPIVAPSRGSTTAPFVGQGILLPGNVPMLQFGPGQYAELPATRSLVNTTDEFTVEAVFRAKLVTGSMCVVGNIDLLGSPTAISGWAFQIFDNPPKARLIFGGTDGKVKKSYNVQEFSKRDEFHHLMIRFRSEGRWQVHLDGKRYIDRSVADESMGVSKGDFFFGDRQPPTADGGGSLAFYSYRLVNGFPYKDGLNIKVPMELVSDTVFLADCRRPSNNILGSFVANTPAARLVGGTWTNVEGSQSAIAGSPQVVTNTSSGNGTAESSTPSVAKPNKAEPPDNDFRIATRKQLRELFKKEYAGLKTTADKLSFANQLLTTARNTRDDLKTRYVLLEEALTHYTDADDQSGAFAVIGMMADDFVVDAWKLKQVALAKIAETAKQIPERKKGIEQLLTLTDEAAAAARFDVAADCLASANTVLSKISDVDLRRRITVRKKEIDDLKKQSDLAELARQRLKTDPENPKANLALGRFLCFASGDWEAGLACLAKGDDEKFKHAAQKELAPAADAATREELANLWASLAMTASPAEKPVMLDRARELLTEAARELTALAKIRVEKRLADIEKQLQTLTPSAIPRPTRKSPTSSARGAKNSPLATGTVAYSKGPLPPE